MSAHQTHSHENDHPTHIGEFPVPTDEAADTPLWLPIAGLVITLSVFVALSFR